MTEQNPNPRRLAPDSKWILSILGAGLVGVVSVTQFQLSSLESARLRDIDQLRQEARDRGLALEQRLSRVDMDINGLREARASQQQNTIRFGEVADRLIGIAMDTQKTAAENNARLSDMVAQSRANTAALTEMAKSQASLSQTLSERVTAIETQVRGALQGPR